MKDSIIPFYIPNNRFLIKSNDCFQYDSEGKEYIDFESGVWCANIGHSHEQFARLIARQVSESIHHGYKFRNHFAEELSVRLQELIGFIDGASVFLSSGSEAVNLSITLARHLTGRKKILKIDNSYLSAFGFGQISTDNPDLVTVKFNDPDSAKNIDYGEIAAFVVETGGASVEMVRFPGAEFIQILIEKSMQNDCLLIAEEVTTGMGRMGKWFGYQYYDFIPDMVVTGKALGNGYPVSAVTISQELNDRFRQNPFRYAQSHQNDPLGCAIGLEVIKIIEENGLIEKCLQTGKYFKSQLDQLKIKHKDKVKEVRARGLMLAIELHDNVEGESMNDILFHNGFVIGFKNNTFRFLPPLTIGNELIDRVIHAMDNVLKINYSHRVVG